MIPYPTTFLASGNSARNLPTHHVSSLLPILQANPFKGGSGANVGNSMLSPESPRELNDAAMRIAINAAAAVRPPRTGPGGGARSPTAADHGVNGVADPSILRHGPVVGGGVPPDTKPRLAGIAAN